MGNKIQYTKDKVARLSFRVNQSLYDWVNRRAHDLGVMPCDFARSVLFGQMSAESLISKNTDCSDCGGMGYAHKQSNK